MLLRCLLNVLIKINKCLMYEPPWAKRKFSDYATNAGDISASFRSAILMNIHDACMHGYMSTVNDHAAVPLKIITYKNILFLLFFLCHNAHIIIVFCMILQTFWVFHIFLTSFARKTRKTGAILGVSVTNSTIFAWQARTIEWLEVNKINNSL